MNIDDEFDEESENIAREQYIANERPETFREEHLRQWKLKQHLHS